MHARLVTATLPPVSGTYDIDSREVCEHPWGSRQPTWSFLAHDCTCSSLSLDVAAAAGAGGLQAAVGGPAVQPGACAHELPARPAVHPAAPLPRRLREPRHSVRRILARPDPKPAGAARGVAVATRRLTATCRVRGCWSSEREDEVILHRCKPTPMQQHLEVNRTQSCWRYGRGG